LELSGHPDSSFVTLTYADEHVPRLVDGTQTLYKRDFQLFLKRLRWKTGPFRYFLAGEYGSKTQRPHAHGIFTVCPSTMIDTIDTAWSFQGHTDVGTASRAAAFYSSGYVTKKMTQSSDERLCGRTPEFSLRSKRPALGAVMVPAIAAAAQKVKDWETKDVPTQVRIGGRKWPLDRYMRSAIRQHLGMQRDDYRVPPLEWPSEEDMCKAMEQEKYYRTRMMRSKTRARI